MWGGLEAKESWHIARAKKSLLSQPILRVGRGIDWRGMQA